jgi:ribosome biogenesis protein Nip4
MNNQDNKTIQFPNIGYLMDDVPSNVLDKIWEEVNEIKNDFSKAIPYNKNLAGNIQHEYQLTKCQSVVEDYIFELMREYENTFRYIQTINVLSGEISLDVKDLWVNFQKKGEVNPVHSHSGLMSFVIWLSIPYTTLEEISNLSVYAAGVHAAGNFSFLYTDTLGRVIPEIIPVDKTYNGKIVLFPAAMNHCVYPFYSSDEYRITIGGNVKLSSEKT